MSKEIAFAVDRARTKRSVSNFDRKCLSSLDNSNVVGDQYSIIPTPLMKKCLLYPIGTPTLEVISSE